MRVKKFEAKTMRDALRMVKEELGPDAVILSAKDHKAGYGLGATGSVEVTAAVSEGTLQKKAFVEARMTSADRERFRQSEAKQQKAIIEQMVDTRLRAVESAQQARASARTGYAAASANAPKRNGQGTGTDASKARISSSISYIDIPDETDGTQSAASERIRAATQNAAQALAGVGTQTSRGPGVGQSAPLRASSADQQIEILRQEVQRLERLVLKRGGEAGLDVQASQPAQGDAGAFMRAKLVESGLSSTAIDGIIAEAQRALGPQMAKKSSVDAWVGKHILDSVRVQAQPTTGRVHLFVGPPGSGKTSMLIKMAADLVVRERKRVAILSTDTIKVGAAEQLRTYSQLLNVPFALIRNRHDWDWLLKQANGIDHLLVDYPGLKLREIDEIQALKSLMPPSEVTSQTHLVLSSAMKDSDANEIARRFMAMGPNDLVFTGLDVSVQHGVIWNIHTQTGLPLHSFGIGRGLPEDFEYATKERVLDLLFKLTRIKSQERMGEA